MTPSKQASDIEDPAAELDALQRNFDEYIASSRELEEELDAELAKMQKKLAESSASNAALASQLDSVTPQLASLERALESTRKSLDEERIMRRKAEMAQDEAESLARSAEGSVEALRSENDRLHEELAFQGSEVEELRYERDDLTEKYRKQLETLRRELVVAQSKNNDVGVLHSLSEEECEGAEKLEQSVEPEFSEQKEFPQEAQVEGKEDEFQETVEKESTQVEQAPAGFGIGDIRDDYDSVAAAATGGDDEEEAAAAGYVKSLEDELEIVTEQLIAERRSRTEVEIKLSQSEQAKVKNESDLAEMEEQLKEVLDEAEAGTVLAQTSAEEANMLKEELALTNQELTLTKEEVVALEEELRKLGEESERELVKARQEGATIAASLEAVKAERAALEQQMEEVMSLAEERDAAETAVREELMSLRPELDRTRSDLIEYRRRESVLETMLKDVSGYPNANNAALNVQIERILEEMKQAVELRDAMQGDLAEAEKKNSSLQLELEEAKHLLGDAPTQPPQFVRDRNNEQAVFALREQLKKAKAEAIEARETNYRLDKKCAKQEEKLVSVERELADVIEELARCKTVLAGMDDGLRSVGLEQEAIAPKVRLLEENLAAMHGDKEVAQEEMLALECRVSELEGENLALRADLEELRSTNGTRCSGTADISNGDKDELRRERERNNVEVQLKEKYTTGVRCAYGESARDVFSAVDLEGGCRVDETLTGCDPGLLASQLRTMAIKYHRQREQNSQLLGRILCLCGNIQVCCRIRPLMPGEDSVSLAVEALSETEVGCLDTRSNTWKSFVFDKVWGPEQKQHEVFQDVEPLALSVVDGYNACIFAYGQTGSGKTYTMEGIISGNQLGISQRTVLKIFHLLRTRQEEGQATSGRQMHSLKNGEIYSPNSQCIDEAYFSFCIEVGMFEIYNDEVFDLLSLPPDGETGSGRSRGKSSLDVRRDSTGRVVIPDLTKEEVQCLDDVMDLLKRGNANRATASTNLNEHSSRSHMVLNVQVSSGRAGQPGKVGHLYLVDLAGSERVRKSEVEGKELKEAQHINKSLSALGDVMEALDKKASHVPYRNSKLTYLLQDCLGGNSRTMMVVTVNPGADSAHETQYALQFATRVRRINLGVAQRNVTSKNQEERIKTLMEEMKALHKAKERSDEQLQVMKREHQRLQEHLKSMKKSRSENQDEFRSREVLRRSHMEMSDRYEKEKAVCEKKNAELNSCQKELRQTKQQLLRMSKERDLSRRLVEDKEQALFEITNELRTTKDALSAANLRSRRSQLMQTSPRYSSNIPTPARRKSKTSPATSVNSDKGMKLVPDGDACDFDLLSTREKIMSLYQKYDQPKVKQVKSILARFKGKEDILYAKLVAKYEADTQSEISSTEEDCISVVSTGPSIESRAAVALAKHRERMNSRRSYPSHDTEGDKQMFSE